MANPAGLGAAGWVCIVLEDTMGTYLPPTTAGAVWVPVLSESLTYTEEPYYSEQIRQQTVDVTREQGFYHVEGDIQMEFDANFAPYFLACSRHVVAGSGGVYTFTPSQAGAAFNNGPDDSRTASITVVRNGVGFGYAGCVMNTIEITIDTGVTRLNVGVMGLSEEEPAGLGTPAWVDAELYGAAAHTVFVDAAGTSPAFATPSEEFNGFTANINYNATAQNRLNGQRSATYVSYGKTEATYATELDFLSRAEYDAFRDSVRRAIRYEAIRGGTSFADCDEGLQVNFYNTVYDSYPVALTGLADLIMASTTGRALAITGGAPFDIKVKSSVALAAIQS